MTWDALFEVDDRRPEQCNCAHGTCVLLIVQSLVIKWACMQQSELIPLAPTGRRPGSRTMACAVDDVPNLESICLLRISVLWCSGNTAIYLALRDRPPFSNLKYDSAIIAPLSAMQLPVNRITDL